MPASESSGAGASTEDMENDFIDRIWRGMWPHLICMSAQADEYSQFAALDEVGLAFSHSSQPNFRVLPITAITPRAITSEVATLHFEFSVLCIAIMLLTHVLVSRAGLSMW